MSKLLLVVLAVALLVWLVFGRRRRVDKPPPRAGAARQIEAEDMVACAHCGLNLPRSEAVDARGLHYCSSEHRDAGVR